MKAGFLSLSPADLPGIPPASGSRDRIAGFLDILAFGQRSVAIQH